jgi:hypothetical protein
VWVLLRRLMLLVAVLLGLSVLAAAIAPREPLLLRRVAPTPTPSPTPTAGPAREIVRTLDVQGLTRPARVRARVGDEVLLTVRSDRLDTVDVDGLTGDKAVDAGSDAQFDLIADVAGSFPIRLTESGRQIGTLEVSPR